MKQDEYRAKDEYRSKADDYRRDDDTYRTDEPSYRKDEPSYRKDEPAYRKDEASYRNDDAAYRKGEASYRKDDGSYRKNEGNYRKDEAVREPIYRKGDSSHRKDDSRSIEYAEEDKDGYHTKPALRAKTISRSKDRTHAPRSTRDEPPPRSTRPKQIPPTKQYDDLPSPPPRKYARDLSPDILEVTEIQKATRKLSSDRKDRRTRSGSRERPSRRRTSPHGRDTSSHRREHTRRSSRSRSPLSRKKGSFKPAIVDDDKHYLERSPQRDSTAIRKKAEPNDFFNDELKKAIIAGRIKMTERELLVDGPNYSHTTNGKEEQYQKCRIFVGHLPVDFLSKDDIFYIFEKYGKLLAISLHKGYAFIQFKNPEMAELAATSENGRRVKGACLEVNLATISKDEARKLPREGATLPPIHRTTSQCRLYIETEHDRMYACQIERKLRALGISVDTTIWKETSRKSRYHNLDDHLLEMQTDPDSICAIQVCKDDIKRKTATVHIFKNDLEGRYVSHVEDWQAHRGVKDKIKIIKSVWGSLSNG